MAEPHQDEAGLQRALTALHDAHDDLAPLGIPGASDGMWHAIFTIQAELAEVRGEPPPDPRPPIRHTLPTGVFRG